MSKAKAPSEKSSRNVIGVRLSDDEIARISAIRTMVGGVPANLSRSQTIRALLLDALSRAEERQFGKAPK